MQRAMRMLPCSKISHSQPFKFFNLPPSDSFCSQGRLICSLQTADPISPPADIERPVAADVRQRSRHNVAVFLQRVLDSYNVLNLLNAGPWNEATASAVQSSNPQLTPYVVSQVIKLCVDLDTALEFYRWWRTLHDTQCMDSHVYVAIMHRLGMAGRTEEMEAVASECESNCMVTVATFTVQISAYRKAANLDGALRTWKRMEKFGLKPSVVTFATMIDAFANMKMYEEAADLCLLCLWEKSYPNVRTISVFIHHLAMAGKLDSAMTIFKDMLKLRVKPNMWTFASLMKGYANLGDIDTVMHLVQQLMDMGIRPHRVRFRSLFRDMVRERREEDAMKVMHEMWPDLSTEDLKGLISHYQDVSRKGEPEEDNNDDAASICEASDVSSDENDNDCSENGSSDSTPLWNFTGFVRCLIPWSATTAMALENAKIKWDGYMVSEIMKRIDRADVAWKFFSWVEGQQGFTHDKFTYMAMIRLLLNEGNFAIVKQLLLEAQSKQLNFPLQMQKKVLHICGMRKEGDMALEMFSLLNSTGLKPDSSTYEQLIHVLYKCGRYWRAATVFAEMEKAGFAPTALAYSFVVCGFAEAGQMKYARAYYSKMRTSGFQPSSQIFSAFIHGFFKIGRLERAEQVFQQMRKDGMEPSVGVYDQMIQVFKRAGKKVELRQIEREREALPSIMWMAKQQRFAVYFRFCQIFKESFEEGNDMQSCVTG